MNSKDTGSCKSITTILPIKEGDNIETGLSLYDDFPAMLSKVNAILQKGRRKSRQLQQISSLPKRTTAK